jgi:hypothetical protein
MKIIDRYSLLCVSIALIIMVTIMINQEEPQNEDRIGIAHDIRQTQNGYTFTLDDDCGGAMKCFTRTEPCEHAVYVVKGSFSEDGSIFFISSLNKIY